MLIFFPQMIITVFRKARHVPCPQPTLSRPNLYIILTTVTLFSCLRLNTLSKIHSIFRFSDESIVFFIFSMRGICPFNQYIIRLNLIILIPHDAMLYKILFVSFLLYLNNLFKYLFTNTSRIHSFPGSRGHVLHS